MAIILVINKYGYNLNTSQAPAQAKNPQCQELIDSAFAEYTALSWYKTKEIYSGKFNFTEDGRAYDGAPSKINYDGRAFLYEIWEWVNVINMWAPSENGVLWSWYYEWSFEFIDLDSVIQWRNACAGETIRVKKVRLLEWTVYYY